MTIKIFEGYDRETIETQANIFIGHLSAQTQVQVVVNSMPVGIFRRIKYTCIILFQVKKAGT